MLFVVQPVTHVSSRRLRESAFRETVAALGASGLTLIIDLAEASPALTELDRRVTAAHRPVRGKRSRRAARRGASNGADWQMQVVLMSIDDSEWAQLAGMTTVR